VRVEQSLAGNVMSSMHGRGWMSAGDIRRAYAESVGEPPSDWRLRHCLKALAESGQIEQRRRGWFWFWRFDDFPPPFV